MNTLLLARRARGVAPSAVREILKVAEQPEMLSFAGGLPAPELFPVDAIARAHQTVLARDGAAALQYSTTEGFGPLREWIAGRFSSKGVPTCTDEIAITSGSQQGIDLVARVLLDPGSVVVTENPSYLAALQVFQSAEARVVTVASDEHGMCVDQLEAVLAREAARLIYLVPSFQNPRGTTLPLARRRALVAIARARGVPVLEDEPYAELRFRGEPLPSLAALDDGDGWVVSLGTFSKTLAPGLRLGWMRARGALFKALVVAKQSVDLHCSSLAQRAVAELFASGFDYEAHLGTIRASYGARAETMLAGLAREMPSGTTWTRPDGGLFVWVELPAPLDASAILPRALEQKVAYVPGAPFFAESPRVGSLRLNFSNRPSERIEDGMKRLGAVVRGAM